MAYNFDNWHKTEGDVIPMWVADMDFPAARPIVEADMAAFIPQHVYKPEYRVRIPYE